MHRPTQPPTRTSTGQRLTKVTTSNQSADLIDDLRTAGVTLTYDPSKQTLRCSEDIAVTIGNGR
jgi:hypothetical protein